jgi:hypothetical protein
LILSTFQAQFNLGLLFQWPVVGAEGQPKPGKHTVVNEINFLVSTQIARQAGAAL